MKYDCNPELKTVYSNDLWWLKHLRFQTDANPTRTSSPHNSMESYSYGWGKSSRRGTLIVIHPSILSSTHSFTHSFMCFFINLFIYSRRIGFCLKSTVIYLPMTLFLTIFETQNGSSILFKHYFIFVPVTKYDNSFNTPTLLSLLNKAGTEILKPTFLLCQLLLLGSASRGRQQGWRRGEFLLICFEAAFCLNQQHCSLASLPWKQQWQQLHSVCRFFITCETSLITPGLQRHQQQLSFSSVRIPLRIIKF